MPEVVRVLRRVTEELEVVWENAGYKNLNENAVDARAVLARVPPLASLTKEQNK